MKDKTTAALFALFLGWFGIHRFYLRQPGLGVLYIILMSMGISFILGIIDAIVLLAMDPEEFDRRYNDEYVDAEYDRYRGSRRQTRERRDYRRTTERTERRATRNSYERRRPVERRERRPARPQPAAERQPRRRPQPQRKRANPYKQSGIKKYKDFDLKAAIEDFNKGLEIEPNDVALHFNLACAYSLTEEADKAFFHIDQAVKNGFKDFNKIKSHDDLAYVRIQSEFDQFESDGFQIVEGEKPQEAPQLEAPKQDLLQDDLLLSQLNRLQELKEKGLITEKEFSIEKQKLMR